MQMLRFVSVILLVVGGLNWGLVGLFDVNVVHAILGGVPVLERLVYILVGLAALMLAIRPETWRPAPAIA